MALKDKLVADWRHSWKWASVQLAAIAGVMAGLLTANPSFALGLIGMLPVGPWRTVAAVGVSLVVFVIPTIARLYLPKDRRDDG